MGWDMTPGDDFDGVQYDTEHAPSAAQLEAAQIRRECYGLRERAAEDLAAEFGNDVSEWLI